MIPTLLSTLVLALGADGGSPGEIPPDPSGPPMILEMGGNFGVLRETWGLRWVLQRVAVLYLRIDGLRSAYGPDWNRWLAMNRLVGHPDPGHRALGGWVGWTYQHPQVVSRNVRGHTRVLWLACDPEGLMVSTETREPRLPGGEDRIPGRNMVLVSSPVHRAEVWPDPPASCSRIVYRGWGDCVVPRLVATASKEAFWLMDTGSALIWRPGNSLQAAPAGWPRPWPVRFLSRVQADGEVKKYAARTGVRLGES